MVTVIIGPRASGKTTIASNLELSSTVPAILFDNFDIIDESAHINPCCGERLIRKTADVRKYVSQGYNVYITSPSMDILDFLNNRNIPVDFIYMLTRNVHAHTSQALQETRRAMIDVIP